MLKIVKIDKLVENTIFISFSNGEKKKFTIALENAEPNLKKYYQSILDELNFQRVKLGRFGQLYWENCGEIIDEKGNLIKCEFDFSPEYIYYNSEKVID
ncbi:MAG: DUF2442 domain-containing protein [Bacteroidota bacterium]|nr:DUF2442 domain-containing protein [Bacteroidota bacterium]